MQRQPTRRTVHGIPIGIMMLDTGFERLPGDIGHATTWDFPVHYKIVRGASGQRVSSQGGGGTLDLFIDAARELAEFGVGGIVTSCGFLARFQKELTRRCPVPVATSSLLQIPLVEMLLPAGRTVGILTADANALTADHFEGVGCRQGYPVAGMRDDGVFKQELLGSAVRVSREAQRREVLEMTERLLEQAPNVGAIVAECTNLAPHSALISETFGLPVYDIVTLVDWFQSGLRPRPFGR